MLFHVTWEVYEEIVLPEVRTVRNEWVGPQLQKGIESGSASRCGGSFSPIGSASPCRRFGRSLGTTA